MLLTDSHFYSLWEGSFKPFLICRLLFLLLVLALVNMGAPVWSSDLESAPAPAPDFVRNSVPLPPENPDRLPQADLPAPSGDPLGDMPPVAPRISRSNQQQSATPAGAFSLHAQHSDIHQDRFMQSLDGNFQDRVLQGNARSNRLEPGADLGSARSLTQVELKKLADHEVILLIDRSGSMSTPDCPTGSGFGRGLGMLPTLLGVPLMSTSRWNWCLQQTSEMSRQTQGIYEQGMTIVLFSTSYLVVPNVTLDSLPRLFSQNFPSGTTNLAQPLALEIGDYFKRRALSRGNVKPLIVGIITDGCPTNRGAVVQALVEATRFMRNPEELTVIFFMIGGMDLPGERFVHDLATNLPARGAVYPIVREVSFSELQQVGLAKAIVQKLQ